MRILLLIAIIVPLLIYSSPVISPGSPEMNDPARELSLKEKVGQMLMVGFEGTSLSPEFRRFLREWKPGGVILFSRNIATPKQLRELTAEIQAEVGEVKAFTAVDEEGGPVSRVGRLYTVFPGNMVLGAADSSELAYKAGSAIARELLSVGINMNLAPVLDVNSQPDNPVIADRSFGEDPLLVARLGTACIRGLQADGVIAVGKHFPGHGDTAVDSHLALPRINKNIADLTQTELVPFAAAVRDGVGAIMVAHILFPTLDEAFPASLSREIIGDLLEGRLGFSEGLVITDDLEMNAVNENFSTEEAAVFAVKAGADMLMFAHHHTLAKQAAEAVINGVESGRINREKIDNAVGRILKAKAEFKVGQEDVTLSRKELSGHRELAEQIAAAGVTLAYGEALPSFGPDSSILLVTALPDNGKLLEEVFQTRYANVAAYHMGLNPSGSGIRNAVLQAAGRDVVVVATYNGFLHPKQIKLVNQLALRNGSVVVLAAGAPYELAELQGIRSAVVCYSYRESALLAGVSVIIGEKEARGKLPVSIRVSD